MHNYVVDDVSIDEDMTLDFVKSLHGGFHNGTVHLFFIYITMQ